MLGERDISIFGRLKDKVNNYSFAQFRLYMNEKLEYIEGKLESTKNVISTEKRNIER